MGHHMFSFLPHAAVFLGLIALGTGYKVYLKACAVPGAKFGKWVGGFISVVALLGLTCIFYLSITRCLRCPMPEHPASMEMPMDDGPKK